MASVFAASGLVVLRVGCRGRDGSGAHVPAGVRSIDDDLAQACALAPAGVGIRRGDGRNQHGGWIRYLAGLRLPHGAPLHAVRGLGAGVVGKEDEKARRKYLRATFDGASAIVKFEHLPSPEFIKDLW